MSKTVIQLNASRVQLGEHTRSIYEAIAEPGTTESDLIEPSYWAHLASRLRAKDRIEVHADDGAWFAELLVLDAGRAYAKVAVLRFIKLEASVPGNELADMQGHEIKHRGHSAQWSVLRGKDVLRDKFATREQASQWLAAHLRAVAA